MDTGKQLNANELIAKLQELEKENARLRKILDVHGIPYIVTEPNVTTKESLQAIFHTDSKLSLQEKVALFRSVFQGRDDIFAKRWYSSTTQKSGYQPVCTREWNREFCDKRKYKCADCPNRQFAPLAYNDFFNHLAGKDAWGRDVIGLYPIRKDNTCSFLCTDFDDKSCEHGYKNDVLVHNKALLEQWKERLETFLEIDEIVEEPAAKRGRKKNSSVIGCLYAGKNTLHGIIDIALIQSCLSDGEAKPFVKDYGMVIVDECHHVSSVSFEQVLRQVTATYVYGLTATPIRKDGHQPIIFMQCGKIRFTADAKSQMENQTFKRLLIPRFTSFRNISSDSKTYVQVTQDLSEDKVRNEFIVEDVRIAIQEGRTPLVLTTRTAHVKALAQMLIPFADHVIQLIGADSAKEKRLALQNLQSMPTSESLVIVATGKYVGEGFDYPRLDTLFLTMPIAWKGNVEQYAGRLHREYAGKNEVRIYDYVDVHVTLCDSMYRKRLKGYLRAGYGKYVTSSTLDKNPQELIYERDNYEATFRNDLAKAQYSVIIAVPKVKFKYKPVIMSTLANIIHNGVTVAVHIKEEGVNEIELKNTGMDVVCNKEQTLQCAIIDKSIVWYGNINFFGYNSETNNVMRIADHKIANEMIEILYSDTENDVNGG